MNRRPRVATRPQRSKELVAHAGGEREARPGIVASVATAGDLLQWHPHLHLITTDSGRATDGSWPTLAQWDAERLMRLFRERLLGSLSRETRRAQPRPGPWITIFPTLSRDSMSA
jgi:hypothetical protein